MKSGGVSRPTPWVYCLTDTDLGTEAFIFSLVLFSGKVTTLRVPNLPRSEHAVFHPPSQGASAPSTDAGAQVRSWRMQPASPDSALAIARAALLGQRTGEHWRGRLSSSALATALAVQALHQAGDVPAAVQRGRQWLDRHSNADGGWGDTPASPSNLPTTLLVHAALTCTGSSGAMPAAERWLTQRSAPDRTGRMAAVAALYGSDRTFAAPIHMACALAGTADWAGIPGLPFELAAVPRGWWGVLRLQVVSYALPALIAVGLCIHQHRPARRLLRRLLRQRVLRLLTMIQPSSGGFLEAVPLTAFVAMALIPVVGAEHEVVVRCREFLRRSQREDGSWAIDSDLACWLTSSSIAALGAGADTAAACTWLAARQSSAPHPYTGAEAGAWAWTDLPGGVPDADDTAGAVVALAGDPAHAEAVQRGVRWLLRLQNGDGGWPTFCRGWGRLPFDQSAPDLTAHVLRALHAAAGPSLAVRRGLAYLQRTQRADGAWLPLWFGDQRAPNRANPVLGTARVLRALELWDSDGAMRRQGIAYLGLAQNADGGWGGAAGVASSVETTALAVAALVDGPVAERGAAWLVAAVADGRWTAAEPIGLYFAQLWYDEPLYPLLWTVEALRRLTTDRGQRSPSDSLQAARVGRL